MAEMNKKAVNFNRGEKQAYIEYIRATATLTVVFLHIVMTLPANYSVSELGIFNSAVFNGCYMPTKWAVPCFIMITGSLLLEPEHKMNKEKVFNYLKRMFLVLLIFGTGYALMELVFTNKSFSLSMIFKALKNTAEGNSWSHLWYIYVLIALYFLTIPFRYITEKADERVLTAFMGVLIVGNFIVPTINIVANINLKNYMILDEYTTYYLLGFWLKNKRVKIGKAVIFPGIIATMIMIMSELYSLNAYGAVFDLNHQSEDILTLIQVVSVFLFIREICIDKNMKIGRMCSVVCKYSFAIYLVHPFFINLIYKLFKITPLTFSIGIGIVVLFIIVFLLSLLAAVVLKQIPIIKRIL